MLRIKVPIRNHSIRRVDRESNVSTVAAAGSPGQYGHTDGDVADARFNDPIAVAVASDGTINVGRRPADVCAGFVTARSPR